MINLSIIVPVYNEVRYLDVFTKRLLNSFIDVDVEYIFVNDGSTDGSKEWLSNFIELNNQHKMQLINIKKNLGKGKALHEGILISKGNYLLFQDADLELDTDDSLEMFNIINNNSDINCVFGSRYVSGKLKKNNNYLNEFFGKINSLIFNVLFNQALSDLHCGTKIISREVMNNINLTITDFGFEIDIASQIAKKKYDIYEYGISYFARSKRQGKKITWIDGLKSYFYLFKTRFLQNDLSITLSILFSTTYMIYVGTYFGMGIGKSMVIFLFAIIGLTIGLHNKLLNSGLILFFIYFGSLFSKGNGRIYTIIVCFIIGIYLSKKISLVIKSKINNKIVNFLF